MDRREWQQGWRRLRWRRRGAWQWPAFLALTAVDAVVLATLPFYEPGPGGLFPSLLLAGFANLVAVALVAPLLGRLVRRRRPDLPRLVARDYAGTMLLIAGAALLVVAGLAHRPAAAAADADRADVLAGVHAYVLDQEPQLRGRLGETDVLQLEADYYRACVPRRQAGRWLCLFVSTDRRPAGLKLDPSETSNNEQRVGSGSG
jgi:hypothetical protein